jgi:hypothetical protein
LLRKGLGFYEAERVEWATRAAADAAAARLDRLKMLDETASTDTTRLRETLGRVFTDAREAARELGGFVQTHGWRELRSTLRQSPQQFGKLRYPRPWYTLGPGRKDVEAILDPLKIAMKSVSSDTKFYAVGGHEDLRSQLVGNSRFFRGQ